MISICYLIMSFGVIRLIVAMVNFFTFRYLPKKALNNSTPKVSILIPARNEEQNIGNLLSDLKTIDYKNLEIIVFNDNSTDKTEEVVNQFSEIKLINGTYLPNNWLGKNYACHQLSTYANGDYYLFLDADVRVNNKLIQRALSHIKKHNLRLLSIFPKQLFASKGEKISVPLMNWILLNLLPLIFVRILKNKAFSAANGQFMMFDAKTYDSVLPHKNFKNHRVEDIVTCKHYKGLGHKVDTLLGDREITCRMYNNFRDASEGFTKNIFQFFGNSKLLTVFFGILTSIIPLAVFWFGNAFLGFYYLATIVLIRIFVSLSSKQSVIENIFFMAPQHFVFIYIILKGLISNRRKVLVWKERNIL